MIIDTDCGIDDIFSILYLLEKGVKIDYIITVDGMCKPEIGIQRLKKILNEKKINDIILIKGIDLNLNLEKYDWFNDCTNNYESFEESLDNSIKKDFPEFLIDDIQKIISKNSGKHDLICLGPLSNLNYYYDKIKNNINKIYIMGSQINIKGNIENSEFNFWCDPISARTVLNKIDNLTILPLDTCFSNENPCFSNENHFEQLIEQLIKSNFSKNIFTKMIHFSNGECLHYDTILVFYYLNNKIINEIKKLKINVDENGFCTKEKQSFFSTKNLGIFATKYHEFFATENHDIIVRDPLKHNFLFNLNIQEYLKEINNLIN